MLAASAMRFRRWLQPGIGVKRWLLRRLRRARAPRARRGARASARSPATSSRAASPQALIDLVTLQFLPFAAARVRRSGRSALGLFVFGAWRLVRAADAAAPRRTRRQPLAEVIYQKRFLARGPRIVAIGGGTGLSTLLRGLKEHTSNLTAIVTVADDGGSSGALRDELGIPPVGDIRNCIAALADAEPLMSELLGYRFPGGYAAPSRAGCVETEPGEPRAATPSATCCSPR